MGAVAGPRQAGHPVPEPTPHGGEREHAWLSCRERDEGSDDFWGEHWALHTLGTGDGDAREQRRVQGQWGCAAPRTSAEERRPAWTDPRADGARATLAVEGKAPALCRQVRASRVPVGKARGMRHKARCREQRSSEKPDWKQPRARASEASSGVGGSDPGLASSCTPGCVAGQSALTGLGPKPAPPRPPGTTMRLGGLWAGTELGCGSVRPHFWVGAAGRPTVTSLSPLEGQSLLKQIFQNLPRLLQCSPPHVSSLPRPGCEGSVPCSFLFRGLGGGWPHAVPQGVTAKTVPGAGPLFYCQASLYTNLSVKCRWGPGQEVRGPRPPSALV